MTTYQTNQNLFGENIYTKILTPKTKKEPAQKAEKTVETTRKAVKKLSIRDNCLVQTTHWQNESFKNEKREQNLLSQCGNDNAYNGYLSPVTANKIRKIVYVVVKSGQLGSAAIDTKKKQVNYDEYYPTFVTLTLPAKQRHSDYEVKDLLLGQFLKWVQGDRTELKNGQFKGQLKGFGVKTYLWRAEVQKNDNIHFHILLDRFVPWERIRAKWNSLLDNLGYIEDYANNQREKHKNGFQLDEKALIQDIKRIEIEVNSCLKAKKLNPRTPEYLVETINKAIEYKRAELEPSLIRELAISKQKMNYERGEKEGWRNPNSTDIHAINQIDSLAAYVSKYMSKTPKKTEYKTKRNEVLKMNDQSDKMEIWRIPDQIYKPEKEYLMLELANLATEYVAEVPDFEERKIDGRLWGCSQNIQKLHNEIFGGVIQEFEETVYSDGSREYEREENKEMTQFVNDISQIAGEQEIEEATKRVGNGFECFGQIIPLNKEKFGIKKQKRKDGKMQYPYVPIEQLIKNSHPQISRKIVTHYMGVFEKLYGNTG